MHDTRIRYEPEEISAPGETLVELIEERGMTQSDLAQRMGRPPKTVSQIIHGKAAITPETATQLEMVLGTPASYWLNHEAHYQAYRARIREAQTSTEWYEWLRKLPLSKMKELGILSPLYNRGKNRDVLLREVLQFFGVNSPTQWDDVYGDMQLAYRLSMPKKSDVYARAVWLRLGELELSQASAKRYDAGEFTAALVKIRSLTTEKPEVFDPLLRSLCAEAGVVVALVEAIPGARVSGAARWINHRPLIQLSLFGKANDRFWFTFFHESGHILEGERGLIYVDDDQNGEVNEAEQRADAFSAGVLIPPVYDNQLQAIATNREIVSFAAEIGIHPAIVVGRLQHDGIISYSAFNSHKEHYRLQ